MDCSKVTSFIKEFYNSQEFVPLSVPKFIGNEKKYLEECIDTTFVSSVGKFVDRFEEEVAAYTGSRKAVVCVSGTNALHMAMLLVGVEREDEILTQALTFVATCNAINYIGANPVFIDVDKETLGLSPKAVNAWLEKNAELKNGVCYNRHSGRRIKACVPMHTFGHPVKIDDLVAVCDAWHIELVEELENLSRGIDDATVALCACDPEQGRLFYRDIAGVVEGGEIGVGAGIGKSLKSSAVELRDGDRGHFNVIEALDSQVLEQGLVYAGGCQLEPSVLGYLKHLDFGGAGRFDIGVSNL